jgi:hypothetical protein
MIQEHNKFKLFATSYAAGAGLPPLLREIEKWVASGKIAPKSVGVEYLENSGRLIMSIGYRDDEAYGISLHHATIGPLGDGSDFTKVEQDISKAVASLQNVICHELFITESGVLTMVFMCRK